MIIETGIGDMHLSNTKRRTFCIILYICILYVLLLTMVHILALKKEGRESESK